MFYKSIFFSITFFALSLDASTLINKKAHKLDFYGKLRVSTSFVSQDSQSSSIHVSDNKSRLGLKGTSHLDNKLSLFYKVELGIDPVDKHQSKNNFIIGRDAYLGLKTNYGSFAMGRFNTPFKTSIAKVDLFNHTLADADSIMGRTTSGKDINLRNNNSIKYISPKFYNNSIQFSSVYSPEDDIKGNTAKKTQNLSTSVIYKRGTIKAILATHHEQGAFKLSDPDGKASAYRLIFRKKINQHVFGFGYEIIQTNPKTSQHNRNAYLLSHQYSLKNNIALKTQYVVASSSTASTGGATQFTLGLSKRFKKHSEIYLLYTQLNADGAKWSMGKQGGSDVFSTAKNDSIKGFSIGYNFNF